MSDFFNEHRELYWYAHDSHGDNPAKAPMYAPHMAGTMFEPYTKNPGGKAFIKSFAGRPDYGRIGSATPIRSNPAGTIMPDGNEEMVQHLGGQHSNPTKWAYNDQISMKGKP